MTILATLPLSSGLDNGYAKIVYNISELQSYQLHWNDRFPPNSTLMIYVESNGINHRRAVGVDYIFIIKDSNNNIVNTTVKESRFQDYRVNDFTNFTREIDTNWEDGAYVAEVHIFDLLNDSIMDKHYQNVTYTLLDGDNIEPNIPYMNRSDIMNSPELMDRQYKKVLQNFYIDKFSDRYPANRFVIENVTIEKLSIAPGTPIQIEVYLKNNFYDHGSVYVDLLLDNNTISNETIPIEAYSSKNISLSIPSEITENLSFGDHIIEIIPTTANTIGLDLFAIFTVSEMEIGIPIRLRFIDLQIDKLTIKPNETINVTVTVENRGRSGIQDIGLLVNNKLEEEKTVHLNFSEMKDVNFTLTKEIAGQYRINLNNTNLNKVFFVEEREILPEEIEKVKFEEERIPRLFIIVILSILAIFIYIIRKKFVKKEIVEVEEINVEDFKKRLE